MGWDLEKPPCNEQSHLPASQIAQTPVQGLCTYNRCNYLNYLWQRLFPLRKEFLKLPVTKITSYQLFSSQALLNLTYQFSAFTKSFLFQPLTKWLIEHLEIIFLGQSGFQPETCWQKDQVTLQCYAADILCKCDCNSLKCNSLFSFLFWGCVLVLRGFSGFFRPKFFQMLPTCSVKILYLERLLFENLLLGCRMFSGWINILGLLWRNLTLCQLKPALKIRRILFTAAYFLDRKSKKDVKSMSCSV